MLSHECCLMNPFLFYTVHLVKLQIIPKPECFAHFAITPRKINIDPENDGLEDYFPFPGCILRFHVNLPGCNSLTKPPSRGDQTTGGFFSFEESSYSSLKLRDRLYLAWADNCWIFVGCSNQDPWELVYI